MFVEPTPHLWASAALASLIGRLLELRCSPSIEACLTQSNTR